MRAMCGIQQKDRIFKNLQMLKLNSAIYQLAMSNSVHYYGHVLQSEDGHVLRRALECLN